MCVQSIMKFLYEINRLEQLTITEAKSIILADNDSSETSQNIVIVPSLAIQILQRVSIAENNPHID